MISEEKIYDHIRENIRRLREKHPVTEEKVTQDKLAKAIGIKRATLTNIEIGNQRAPIHVIYRLCDFFSVSLDEFLPQLSDLIDENSNVQIDVGGDKHTLPSKASALVDRVRASHSL